MPDETKPQPKPEPQYTYICWKCGKGSYAVGGTPICCHCGAKAKP